MIVAADIDQFTIVKTIMFLCRDFGKFYFDKCMIKLHIVSYTICAPREVYNLVNLEQLSCYTPLSTSNKIINLQNIIRLGVLPNSLNKNIFHLPKLVSMNVIENKFSSWYDMRKSTVPGFDYRNLRQKYNLY